MPLSQSRIGIHAIARWNRSVSPFRAFRHIMAESHAKKSIDPEVIDDDVVSLLSDIAVDEVIAHPYVAEPNGDSSGASRECQFRRP